VSQEVKWVYTHARTHAHSSSMVILEAFFFLLLLLLLLLLFLLLLQGGHKAKHFGFRFEFNAV